MDFRQYARPIWARRWLVLAVVAIVTVATYVYYDHQPERFRATSTIFVQTSELEQSLGGVLSFNDSARATSNQARLLTTEGVARDVAAKIGHKGDPLALLSAVKAVASDDTDFITITAVGNTPTAAADIANGFAAAFISLRSRDARGKVQRALTSARKELAETPFGLSNQDARDAVKSQIRRLQIGLTLPSGTAEIAERAFPVAAPFEPEPAKNAIFAFFLSMLFAIAVAFGLERLDRRVRDVEELEAIFGLPVLAALPSVAKTAEFIEDVPVLPHRLREASRSLRLNVDLGSTGRRARTLLVASALSGEGKSTVVRCLALAYAEAGRRVAVLEADLRRPSLDGYFGIKRGPGATDVLANEVGLAAAEQAVEVHSEGGMLTVLTAGPLPANPPAVLGSDQFRDMLAQLTERFDVVLIDSPPLLLVSDALTLVNEVDGVLLVARMSSTTRDAARRLVQSVQRVPDVNVLGVVANDVAADSVQDYLYYGHYGPGTTATADSARASVLGHK
jgi:capsular exopolysaccharide synthesis family protein